MIKFLLIVSAASFIGIIGIYILTRVITGAILRTIEERKTNGEEKKAR
jgi:hypothetical protein